MTVVIAGCGDLGTEVGIRLGATGRTVLGLRREAHVLPGSFDKQAIDLGRAVPILPVDTDIVVIATAADARTAESYRAAYVDALVNTFEGLRRARANPRRILLVSSTAVYGADDGRWVDESTPLDPSSVTGNVLVEAESALHRRVPEATLLRLSGIYGPGRTRLIEHVRSGSATIPRNPRYTNRIHRDDAAEAIVHLTTRVDSPASAYIGCDDEPAPRADVLTFLADELGVPRPRVDDAASTRGANKRCRNQRLRDSGFTFTHPTYRHGYRAVLSGDGIRHP